MHTVRLEGQIMLLDNYWGGFGSMKGPCAVALDYFTLEPTAPVGGDGCRFFSAYCENDRVYVFATLDNRVYCYTSEDLCGWRRTLVLEMPGMQEMVRHEFITEDGSIQRASYANGMTVTVNFADGSYEFSSQEENK